MWRPGPPASCTVSHVFVGRQLECERIDALLDAARRSSACSLVLLGEAGAGKTALLDYAASRAEHMRVLRAVGTESERDLEFSALHELSRPLLDSFQSVPDVSRQALESALGLRPDRSAGDRFLVGAAVLSLLAVCAEQTPLLLLCDDVHWFDRASLDALLFAVRRLDADAVAVVYATRPGAPNDLARLEELVGGGLGAAETAALLGGASGAHVDLDVASRLALETGGNALALVELRALLTPAQLAGSEVLADGVVPGTRAEAAFAPALNGLPESCESALLVVALATRRTMPAVVRALELRGLEPAFLGVSETAGLISVAGGRVDFRHPLARSAVVHRATPSERRAAHAGLACALPGKADLEARAWHRAGASLLPDEDVAAELSSAAQAAEGRGGFAGASAAWERAAELSPGDDDRQQRLLAAAEAAWRGGAPDRAESLLEEPLGRLDDDARRARALRLRGALSYFAGAADEAAAAFLDAADLLIDADPWAAVATAGDAVSAQFPFADAARMLACADRVARLSAGRDPDVVARGDLARGYSLCFGGRLAEGRELLARGFEALDPGRQHDLLAAGRLSWAHAFLGQDEEARSVVGSAIARARVAGAVGPLSYLLSVSAVHDIRVGRWQDARACLAESLQLSLEVRQPVIEAPVRGVFVVLAALRGDEALFGAHAEIAEVIARRYGFVLYGLLVEYGTGLMLLGTGRVEEAIRPLAAAAAGLDENGIHVPGFSPVFDLIEVYARSGRNEEGAEALRRAATSETLIMPREAGLVARCRGLLAPEESFAEPFVEAIALHGDITAPFELGRTHLCFGERLRRAGHRIDARDQLRLALAVFDELGASGWAERARAELRATGETLRREAVGGDELTPQEFQIATQVAGGMTNREVGAALFLSPKTVEFHLGRVYRKLSIRSRRELAAALTSDVAAR
jgi:DNA-binding CsgD family transcriptional regulator